MKVTPVGSVQLTIQMVTKEDIQPEKRMMTFANDNLKTLPSESNLSLDLKGESLRVVIVGGNVSQLKYFMIRKNEDRLEVTVKYKIAVKTSNSVL